MESEPQRISSDGGLPEERENENNDADFSIATLADELCPFYMTIGIDYNTFWFGDYTKFAFYVKHYQLVKQQKSDDAWLSGLYVFYAMSTALANLNLDGKKRKPRNYMEEPIRVIPYSEAEKKANAERERKRLIDYLNSLAAKQEKKQVPSA